MGNLNYKDFKEKTDINDEKLEKLKKYLNLIKIWQKKFNLVSQNSFEFIWERHFLDSYQILKLIGNKKRILDIGSGAGFPAIVCAICSNNNFDLVEANKKKCRFLNNYTFTKDTILTQKHGGVLAFISRQTKKFGTQFFSWLYHEQYSSV